MNSIAVVALQDPYSKICDDNDDVDSFTVLEERVDVPCGGIALPCLPIFIFSLVS